ncbi:prephenate dehydrogenase [Plantibacter sp. VKM Ac-1784]|uniref:Prephenate dehydrogenase n=1 Tax=Plantibacter elymi (nom. nud.) TaxID=199708 RepID=A0ABY1RJ16_9MICO|nr:prephenate dehydrogenase [Plantibacter sp. VKM Ac-1784]SMQ75565.1 prephenate dehydrogenase [Plantibacter sp. VKM Ac-1784]
MSDLSSAPARVQGSVRIVGAGLLGASIGLALRAKGVDIILDDASPSQLRLAIDYGAGRAAEPTDDPSVVVICVPPDVTARVIEAELAAFPRAVVTDVASVKLEPYRALLERGVDLTRYIGSHPLAGRERGGAISARADLFLGRPWVICRDAETPAWALSQVEGLALDLGTIPMEMTPDEHDRFVALVSHTPQLVASLLAAQLQDAEEGAIQLAGQGLRDTVRIASSAPELWVQILSANHAEVLPVLEQLSSDLASVISALRDPEVPGARRTIADAIAAGNTGVARLPGKHGQNRRFASIVVLLDDRPGQLGALFTELGEIGVNIEDLRLEHSPGANIGLAEVQVLPEVKQRTVDDLESRGWRIAEV